MKSKLLSVIVPAYKQEKTIRRDLEAIAKTLEAGLPANYDFEIICVVDGRIDNTEKEALRARGPSGPMASPKIKVLSYKENKGKGYAVRFGMKYAQGDLVSFLDAGREIGPKGIMMLMAHLDWYKADIIVGSKRHPASQVAYPLVRKILSIGYQFLVRILLGIAVADTQSGIKIFRRGVVDKILPRLMVERYAMDVEMLAVANRLGFRRIYEAPIEVRYKFEDLTHASTLKSIFQMFWDTLAVFYRLHILRYYDDKNRKNWLPYK